MLRMAQADTPDAAVPRNQDCQEMRRRCVRTSGVQVSAPYGHYDIAARLSLARCRRENHSKR